MRGVIPRFENHRLSINFGSDSYSSDASGTCVCNIGFIKDGTSTPPVCVRCSAGKFTTGTNQDVCQLCPAGSKHGGDSARAHVKRCITVSGPCSLIRMYFVSNAGTYSGQANPSTSCIDCPTGSFSATEASTCTSCPADSTTTVGGNKWSIRYRTKHSGPMTMTDCVLLPNSHTILQSYTHVPATASAIQDSSAKVWTELWPVVLVWQANTNKVPPAARDLLRVWIALKIGTVASAAAFVLSAYQVHFIHPSTGRCWRLVTLYL